MSLRDRVDSQFALYVVEYSFFLLSHDVFVIKLLISQPYAKIPNGAVRIRKEQNCVKHRILL